MDGRNFKMIKVIKLTKRIFAFVIVLSFITISGEGTAFGAGFSQTWSTLKAKISAQISRFTPSSKVTVPPKTDPGMLYSVDAGGNHALILDGTNAYSFGDNSFGQLGTGDFVNSINPKIINALYKQGAISVAAGLDHSLALKSDGTVMSWGNNDTGQLGQPSTQTKSSLPVIIQGLTNVKVISAGNNFSLAVRLDGTVWGWGANDKDKYQLGFIGQKSFKPIQINGLSNIKTVSGGTHHGVALDNTDKVWTWGSSLDGRLGRDGPYPSAGEVKTLSGKGIIAVAAGPIHSLAVDKDGNVWAWGSNYHKQLGTDKTSNSTYAKYPVQVTGVNNIFAVAAGNSHSLALAKDGTVWMWGNGSITPAQVTGLTNIYKITAGYNYSIAVDKDGTVWRWGTNPKVVSSALPTIAMGLTEGKCQPTEDVEKSCDGKDNDCDGMVDNIEGKSDPLQQSCNGTNAYGTCSGIKICSAGTWSTCNTNGPNECKVCGGPALPNFGMACSKGQVGTACEAKGKFVCNKDGNSLDCDAVQVANGTTCDDSNKCTQKDTCSAGLCVGSNPKTCVASDQCHDAGVCDKVTGICSDPPKPSGTACNDNDKCTSPDKCDANGKCQGTPYMYGLCSKVVGGITYSGTMVCNPSDGTLLCATEEYGMCLVNSTAPLPPKVQGTGEFKSLTSLPLAFEDDVLTSLPVDADNDGDEDLIVAIDPGVLPKVNIKLFINNGDDTFIEATGGNGGAGIIFPNVTDTYYSQKGGKITKLIAGDANNDGDMDVFVFSTERNHEYVLLNNSKGRFTQVLLPAFSGDPGYVGDFDLAAWADFNGDKLPDILEIGYAFARLLFTHISSNGELEFEDATANSGIPIYGRDMFIFDIDSDGDTDILLTNRFASSLYNEFKNIYSVALLNDSSGKFVQYKNAYQLPCMPGYSSPTVCTVLGGPEIMEPVDADKDGTFEMFERYLDENSEYPGFKSTRILKWNQNEHKFKTVGNNNVMSCELLGQDDKPECYEKYAYKASWLADINGDGNKDVINARGCENPKCKDKGKVDIGNNQDPLCSSSTCVDIDINNGNYTSFTGKKFYTHSTWLSQLQTLKDGNIMLLGKAGNYLLKKDSSCSGGYADAYDGLTILDAPNGDGAKGMLHAYFMDINGDGFNDVFATGCYSQDSAAYETCRHGLVYLNDKKGGLKEPINTGVDQSDGRYFLGACDSAAFIDVNGDGKKDVICGGVAGYPVYINKSVGDDIKFEKGDVAVIFQELPIGKGLGKMVRGGDVNGDGKDDLVISEYGGLKTPQVLINSGGKFVLRSEGLKIVDLNICNNSVCYGNFPYLDMIADVFSKEGILSLNLGHDNLLAVFDADNDGHPDMLFGSGTEYSCCTGIKFFHNVDGKFVDESVRVPQFSLISRYYDNFKIADVNGDGYKDIVVGARGASKQRLLLNDKSGYFNEGTDENGWLATDFPLVDSTAIALSDVDGDGDVDMFVARKEGGVLLYNTKGEAKKPFTSSNESSFLNSIIVLPTTYDITSATPAFSPEITAVYINGQTAKIAPANAEYNYDPQRISVKDGAISPAATGLFRIDDPKQTVTITYKGKSAQINVELPQEIYISERTYPYLPGDTVSYGQARVYAIMMVNSSGKTEAVSANWKLSDETKGALKPTGCTDYGGSSIGIPCVEFTAGTSGGTVSIIAEYGGLRAEKELTIAEQAFKVFKVVKKCLDNVNGECFGWVGIGQKVGFYPTVIWNDGSETPVVSADNVIGKVAVCTTDDPSGLMAKFDQPSAEQPYYMLTGLAQGRVTVTCQYDDKTASDFIDFYTKQTFRLEPEDVTVTRGTKVEFKAFMGGDVTNGVLNGQGWSSSDPTIADFIAGTSTLVTYNPGQVKITGKYIGNTAEVTLTVTGAGKITIYPAITSLKFGETRQLSVYLENMDGSGNYITSTGCPGCVTWLATGDVEITADGKVTGKAVTFGSGNGTVKAKYLDSSSTISFVVEGGDYVTSLSPEVTDLGNLKIGQSGQLRVNATWNSGSVSDVTQMIYWRSSDTSVAFVDSNGVVTAVGPGTAWIEWAYDREWCAPEKYIKLNVLDQKITSLVVTISPPVPPDNTIASKEAGLSLVVTGGYSDGGSVNLTSHITGTRYSSSSPDIATVGPDGLVKGNLRNGEATITVTNSGLSAQLVVKVDMKSEKSYLITPSLIYLDGATTSAIVSVKLAYSYSADPPSEITSGITLETKNEQVAAVSGSTVTRLGPGTTDIKVKYNDTEIGSVSVLSIASEAELANANVTSVSITKVGNYGVADENGTIKVDAKVYGNNVAGLRVDFIVEPEPSLVNKTPLLGANNGNGITDAGGNVSATLTGLSYVGTGYVYAQVKGIKSDKWPIKVNEGNAVFMSIRLGKPVPLVGEQVKVFVDFADGNLNAISKSFEISVDSPDAIISKVKWATDPIGCESSVFNPCHYDTAITFPTAGRYTIKVTGGGMTKYETVSVLESVKDIAIDYVSPEIGISRRPIDIQGMNFQSSTGEVSFTFNGNPLKCTVFSTIIARCMLPNSASSGFITATREGKSDNLYLEVDNSLAGLDSVSGGRELGYEPGKLIISYKSGRLTADELKQYDNYFLKQNYHPDVGYYEAYLRDTTDDNMNNVKLMLKTAGNVRYVTNDYVNYKYGSVLDSYEESPHIPMDIMYSANIPLAQKTLYPEKGAGATVAVVDGAFWSKYYPEPEVLFKDLKIFSMDSDTYGADNPPNCKADDDPSHHGMLVSSIIAAVPLSYGDGLSFTGIAPEASLYFFDTMDYRECPKDERGYFLNSYGRIGVQVAASVPDIDIISISWGSDPIVGVHTFDLGKFYDDVYIRNIANRRKAYKINGDTYKFKLPPLIVESAGNSRKYSDKYPASSNYPGVTGSDLLSIKIGAFEGYLESAGGVVPDSIKNLDSDNPVMTPYPVSGILDSYNVMEKYSVFGAIDFVAPVLHHGGTSAAAPYFSGLAALIIGHEKNKDYSEILEQTTLDAMNPKVGDLAWYMDYRRKMINYVARMHTVDMNDPSTNCWPSDERCKGSIKEGKDEASGYGRIYIYDAFASTNNGKIYRVGPNSKLSELPLEEFTVNVAKTGEPDCFQLIGDPFGAIAVAKDGSLYVGEDLKPGTYEWCGGTRKIEKPTTRLFHIEFDAFDPNFVYQCFKTDNDDNCKPPLKIELVTEVSGYTKGLDVRSDGMVGWYVVEQGTAESGAKLYYLTPSVGGYSFIKKQGWCYSGDWGFYGGGRGSFNPRDGSFIVGDANPNPANLAEVITVPHPDPPPIPYPGGSITEYKKDGSCSNVYGVAKGSVITGEIQSDGTMKKVVVDKGVMDPNYIAGYMINDVRASPGNIYFSNNKFVIGGSTDWDKTDYVYSLKNDPPSFNDQKVKLEENSLLEVKHLSLGVDEYSYLYSAWQNDSGLLSIGFNFGNKMEGLSKFKVQTYQVYGNGQKSSDSFYLDFLTSW